MNPFVKVAFVAAVVTVPLHARADDEPAVKQDAPKVIKVDGETPDKLQAVVDKALETAAPKTTATVSPEAQKVLDSVRDAYAKLTSLELAGTVSANYLVGAQKQVSSDTFTATFQSPVNFRHEMKDDMVVGSAGEKVYAYLASQNLYMLKDGPKNRGAVKDLPEPLNRIIPSQNPSLAMALSKDAGEQLIADGTEVKKLPDIIIGDQSFLAIGVTSPAAQNTYLIDPKTFLVRQVIVDQRAYLQKLGQADVTQAQLKFDYTTSTSGAPIKEGLFAWTPPTNARDLSTVASARGAGDDENPGAKLEGKASPDFTLPDLGGKNVQLSGLKGSVVVVDFWATWCGPCVQSLPHLNKLYEDLKGTGLKVIAVSVDEDKAKVPTFVADKKLTFTVVIDTEEAKVAQKFAVNGIPQTVVIGKDGKVRKVFVGFGPGSEEKLRAEVEAAMK